MAFDNPWAVSGARTGPDVARTLAYVATMGAEGVVGSGDFKVSAQGAPNGSVQIANGAGAALNLSAGGMQQTYILRNAGIENLTIAPTTAGAARSDLIVARVEDPQYSPWQPQANVEEGPYAYYRVVSGVDKLLTLAQLRAQLGYACIILARIDLPVSTSYVTQTMITDLRRMFSPRTLPLVRMGGPTPGLAMQNAGGAMWPDYRPSIEVPSWATHVSIVANLVSLVQLNGNCSGVLTATLGVGASQVRAANAGYNFDEIPWSQITQSLMVGGAAPVPASMRGTTQVLGTEALRNNGSAGWLGTAAGTQVIYQVMFTEQAL